MSFSIKHARYFVAAARSGQMSRAAADLNVSQSAVTAAIQHLESILGLRLLERRATGVTLTLSGARFLVHAERIVDAVNEAARLGVDTPTGPTGEMRLGMTNIVSGYFATPLLVRARRLFPNVDIVIKEASRLETEADIIAGDVDFAIVLTSNLRNPKEIAHETLVKSKRRLWLQPEHPLTRKPSVSLADLTTERYICLTVDEAMATQQAYWKAIGSRPNVIFETSSVEAVRSMVAAGMGVTVLSDMVFRHWSLDGQRISTIDLVDEIPSMDVGLAWAANRPLAPSVEFMIEFFKRSLIFDAGGSRADIVYG